MQATINAVKKTNSHVSNYCSDVTQYVFGEEKSVLTKEQLNTILYFSSSCRAYADKGRYILDTIPPINKDAHFELENVFSQMISQLNQIDEIILQQKCAGQSSSKFAMTGGFVGAATAGAAKGLLVGAPISVMDAGLVAAIGAIIGALAGATIGTRSDSLEKNILLPNLVGVTEYLKNVEILMGQAY